MTSETEFREFSFLASGPTFEVSIPAYFDLLPEMSSPLVNGRGGRSFDFIPYDRDEFPSAELEFIRMLVGADGHAVELYRRIESPPVWFLRWPLKEGALTTHLRSVDGEGFADTTTASLRVIEASNGLPFLLPELPLRFFPTTAPGFQEDVAYYSREMGDSWSVGFQRPSFAAAGVVIQAPLENTQGLVLLRTGLPDGVEAQLWAGYDLVAGREAMDLVVSSFGEKSSRAARFG